MDSLAWQRVLVLQNGFLGDTVLTLPLLSEIKLRYPSAKLVLACSPLAKELLQDHPDIDEIIVDDKKGSDRGLLGIWRKATTLKKMSFTVALTPHKSLRSALMLYFAGIPLRVGFRQSAASFLFHRRVTREPQRHDVERNLSLLRAFGIQPEDCRRSMRLPPGSGAEAVVKKLLISMGVDEKKTLVGINPGSVWATKRWSAEGFAEAIQLIRKNYDCDVLLFGGPSDVVVASRIQELCGGTLVNLAGKIGLREMPAALNLCRVLITNDSAPMHIAVACGVPTVAIFCATTPALGFYPYSDNAILLEKDLSCRPCGSHGGRRCPLGTEDCIRLISPTHVLQVVAKLLERKRESAPAGKDAFSPEFISV
jgi:heptosyltransferase-2